MFLIIELGKDLYIVKNKSSQKNKDVRNHCTPPTNMLLVEQVLYLQIIVFSETKVH